MLQSLLCSKKAHPTEETGVACDGRGEGKVNPEKSWRNICCAGVDWCAMSWATGQDMVKYKMKYGRDGENCEVKQFIMTDMV